MCSASRLRSLYTDFVVPVRLLLCHVLLPSPADPQPWVMRFAHRLFLQIAVFLFRDEQLSSHVTPAGPLLMSEARRFPLTLPLQSPGSRFIYISDLLYIPVKCMLGKSQLVIYIYTHTNVTPNVKKKINKLLQLKYLKFHWWTDGPH